MTEILSSRGYLVDNGTTVLVLGYGGFLSVYTKVRILEGEYAGEAGFVPNEWVRSR